MPYPDFLRGLLQEELLLRPELNRQLFLRYLDDRFVTQGRSLSLIGPPPASATGANERQRAPSALASEALIHEALFVAFRLQCRFKKSR
jgi:hypothetical protein